MACSRMLSIGNRTAERILLISLIGVSFQLGSMTSSLQRSVPWHVPFDKNAPESCDALVSCEQENERLKRQNAKLRKETFGMKEEHNRFPKEMHRFALGAARTSRSDFLQSFDFGYPAPEEKLNTKEVLILYNDQGSVPTEDATAAQVRNFVNGVFMPPLLSVEEATENCEVLRVLTIEEEKPQCLALVGQRPHAFHVQNWARAGKSGTSKQLPLRITGRTYVNSRGIYAKKPPSRHHQTAAIRKLQRYLDSIGQISMELQPILRTVTSPDKAVIVMTCNYADADLLINFVCHAKGHGIDLSHLLFFPTDDQIHTVAKSLGLNCYYNAKIFEGVPTVRNKLFGDTTFMEIMLAKVLTVHMVNWLGYNILFSDVDLVYNKDPLPYFQNLSNSDAAYDIIFQDDHSRRPENGPYFGNSGFYWVKHNDKTRSFLTDMVVHLDRLQETRSHQHAMEEALAEHASYYGMRVKVLEKESHFPSGGEYVVDLEYMQTITSGEFTPYVFHMSWTDRKEEKLKRFQQMGYWHVRETCMSGNVASLVNFTRSVAPLQATCCLAKPFVQCHYQDLPSIIPCHGSPTFLRKGYDYWQRKGSE